MNAHNTYQEAKIDNPSSEIYTDGQIFFTEDRARFYYDKRKCNPADYCMTTKEFTNKGFKSSNGDIYLTSKGLVVNVDFEFALDINKHTLFCSDKSFILHASSLEQIETPEEKEAFDVIEKSKPKQKKFDYIKVDCQSLEFWECAKEYQSEIHIYWKDSEGKQVIQDLNQLVEHYRAGIIYRKVIRELTDRELFIYWFIRKSDGEFRNHYKNLAGKLFDSGKFKLVDGD